MQVNSLLFHSPITLAHHYWGLLLSPGDVVIDATCGNGKDTLFLAQKVLPQGFVFGLDLQPQAIQNTLALLQNNLPQELLSQIHLFQQSHETFPEIAYQKKISLIVYNLGYLPGGDKRLTTACSSTLTSIQKALDLVTTGGVISITCYPGHEEGAKEENLLKELLSTLPQDTWNVCHHTWVNREKAPSLFLLQKKP
jgi:SAM-dependent methyltransferase